MKKIDIEKWERKTPELPENFFNEMQEKVLEKTTRKDQAKTFSLVNPNSVWYSIAAAVVVIFGLSFFFRNNANNQAVNKPHKITATNNGTKHSDYQEPKTVSQIISEKKIDTNKHIKSTEKVSFANHKTIETKKDNDNFSAKQKMDAVLNSMSNEELDELAYDYEQDLYLQLY